MSKTRSSNTTSRLSGSPPLAVIAIPARDEAERLPACLKALAGQVDDYGRPLPAGDFGVIFFVNNSCDDSARIIRQFAARTQIEIRVIEAKLPRELSNAGAARKAALDLAAAWFEEDPASDGFLLTTDADSQVAPDWVCATLKAFNEGAEAVLGRISLDEEGELLSPALHARGKLEAVYEDLLTELSDMLDPQDYNVWPHHSTISGASMALTHALYSRVGGLPDVPFGEDKALVALLRRHNARIRFAPEVTVVTSGRTIGRAAGGVADALRLRNQDPAVHCDEALEECEVAYRRALWRGRLRRGGIANTSHWQDVLCVPMTVVRDALTASGFGEAWEIIEQGSPRLARQPLTPAKLPHQIEVARRLLRRLNALEPADEYINSVLRSPVTAANFNEIA